MSSIQINSQRISTNTALISSLQKEINNIPSVTDVAKLNEANIFTEDNTFQGDKQFIVNITNSATSAITFAGRETNIQSGLIVGSGTTAHVDAKVSGVLYVNQSAQGGTDDRAFNYITTPKVELTTAPVDGTDAATKYYVDTEISNAGSNFAELNQSNTFTQTNTFTQAITAASVSLQFPPVNATDATTKDYVDTEITNIDTSNFAKLDQTNTFTQTITAPSVALQFPPVNATDATTKNYVDTEITNIDTSNFAKLDQTNTFTQTITAPSVALQFPPVNATDATTKNYVDTEITNIDTSNFAKLDQQNTFQLKISAPKVAITTSPVNADDATTKSYVDTEVGTKQDTITNLVSDGFLTAGENITLTQNGTDTTIRTSSIYGFRAVGDNTGIVTIAGGSYVSDYLEISTSVDSYDTTSNYTTGTNGGFTPTISGWYRCIVSIFITTLVTGSGPRRISITETDVVNATEVQKAEVGNFQAMVSNFGCMIYMTAGLKYRIKNQQFNTIIEPTPTRCWWECYLVQTAIP